jgi:uncharacterized protein (TIGR02118 family)
MMAWIAARATLSKVKQPIYSTRRMTSVVKLVFVARRRPELSKEEFARYWFEEHAALVRSLQDTIRIRKYVQSHTILTEMNAGFSQARGMPVTEPADGIAEAWWDSIEDMQDAFSGEEGERAGKLLVEDEGKFVDFQTSHAFLTEEKRII